MRIRFGDPAERKALEALQFRASTYAPEYREAILEHPEVICLPSNLLVEHRVRVVDDGAAPVGFSVLLRPKHGAIELDGLFVEPSSWRRGIATALMLDAVAIARSKNVHAIEVTANPLAEGFYVNFGFTHIGETPTQFGPGLRMRYQIALHGG